MSFWPQWATVPEAITPGLNGSILQTRNGSVLWYPPGNEGDQLIIESGLPVWKPAGFNSLTNFDDRNDPFVLYNFDLGLTNLGNAGSVGDLSAAVVTPFFTDIQPGKKGIYIPSAADARLQSSGVGGLFYNGDITLLIMTQADQYGANQKFLMGFGGAGTGAAGDNILYSIQWTPIFGGPRPWGWLSESGAGVDSLSESPAGVGTPNIHNLVQIGVVRSGLNVSVWLNGTKYSTNAIVAPTGGTNAANRLFIGGAFRGITSTAGIYYGAKGVKRAYTDDEMREEYNYTMGDVFGRV